MAGGGGRTGRLALAAAALLAGDLATPAFAVWRAGVHHRRARRGRGAVDVHAAAGLGLVLAHSGDDRVRGAQEPVPGARSDAGFKGGEVAVHRGVRRRLGEPARLPDRAALLRVAPGEDRRARCAHERQKRQWPRTFELRTPGSADLEDRRVAVRAAGVVAQPEAALDALDQLRLRAQEPDDLHRVAQIAIVAEARRAMQPPKRRVAVHAERPATHSQSRWSARTSRRAERALMWWVQDGRRTCVRNDERPADGIRELANGHRRVIHDDAPTGAANRPVFLLARSRSYAAGVHGPVAALGSARARAVAAARGRAVRPLSRRRDADRRRRRDPARGRLRRRRVRQHPRLRQRQGAARPLHTHSQRSADQRPAGTALAGHRRRGTRRSRIPRVPPTRSGRGAEPKKTRTSTNATSSSRSASSHARLGQDTLTPDEYEQGVRDLLHAARRDGRIHVLQALLPTAAQIVRIAGDWDVGLSMSGLRPRPGVQLTGAGQRRAADVWQAAHGNARIQPSPEAPDSTSIAEAEARTPPAPEGHLTTGASRGGHQRRHRVPLGLVDAIVIFWQGQGGWPKKPGVLSAWAEMVGTSIQDPRRHDWGQVLSEADERIKELNGGQWPGRIWLARADLDADAPVPDDLPPRLDRRVDDRAAIDGVKQWLREARSPGERITHAAYRRWQPGRHGAPSLSAINNPGRAL